MKLKQAKYFNTGSATVGPSFKTSMRVLRATLRGKNKFPQICKQHKQRFSGLNPSR